MSTLRNSVSAQPAAASSPFLALPIAAGHVIRLLGPRPDQAAVAVEPFVRIDGPITAVQSFVGALCSSDGRLVQPIEIELVVDPATVVPDRQVPLRPVLQALRKAPRIRRFLSAPAGLSFFTELVDQGSRLGPMIFCRKGMRLFLARSPRTCGLLSAVPADEEPTSDHAALPPELLTWDGPAEGSDEPLIYGDGGGDGPLGPIHSLDDLLSAQGRVVQRAVEMQQADPGEAVERGAPQWCCQCEECRIPDDEQAQYKASLDRLIAVNAAEVPLLVSPLGAWRLNEAARVIGGLPPRELPAVTEGQPSEFEQWRRRQAVQMQRCGPLWLLSGENDGRELLEVARLKLRLFEQVLERLDAVWRASARPHLCWNDQTVHAAWSQPGATPGAAWGFEPILRKAGLHPLAPFETPDERPLAYPPVFSDKALLPPEVVEAARYFDEARSATLFVRKAKKQEGGVHVRLLAEGLGIPWNLFVVDDAVHVAADGWRAVLSPCAERDPNDGEGLPFEGLVAGEPGRVKTGEEFANCQMRWYPRFGQAVDLHAVGMLLLEALLGQDERHGVAFYEAVLAERDELTQAALTVPAEQRDEFLRARIAERSEVDAPAAVWSRRNLLYRRDDRNATRLDAFPAPLWLAIVTTALRMITTIPGFSYCEHRGCAAPRLAGELLPLIEWRGLVALLDDRLFGRAAPHGKVREVFEKE